MPARSGTAWNPATCASLMRPSPISPTPSLPFSIVVLLSADRADLAGQHRDARRPRRLDDVGLLVADLLAGLGDRVELDVDDHAERDRRRVVVVDPALFGLEP